MNFSNKKILVTGGAGFLGSWLCQRLLSEGNTVICLDNLFTGNKDNIKHLEQNSKFRFVMHDVIQPYDEKVDEIYNLACPASPPHYQKNHVYTIKTCVCGIMNMLELAQKYNARILQASTSQVYGNPLVHPQTQEYWGNVNMNGIRSCYDQGKRCAQSILNAYRLTYNTRIKIIRIFNTYGPGMDPEDGRVVSNFIIQALQNKPITIYGDGQQTRSFCYRDDLIEGMIRLMNTEDEITGPVNVGNPGQFTMLQLAYMVKQLTGSDSEIIFKPLPKDDPVQRRPDISKAREFLQWEPKIQLRQGLKRTIEYFSEKIKQ